MTQTLREAGWAGWDCVKEALVTFSGIYSCQSLCNVRLGASSSSHRKTFLGEGKTSKPELSISAKQNKIL